MINTAETMQRTLSEEAFQGTLLSEPFKGFESVPTQESRLRCLEKMREFGLDRLLLLMEWAPGWVSFLVKEGENKLVSRLMNVLLFHYQQTSKLLGASIDSCLVAASQVKFPNGASMLDFLSREVCPPVVKASWSRRDAYWYSVRIHPFIESCLAGLNVEAPDETAWSVARRVLQTVCKENDTSMIPMLVQLRHKYLELNQRRLRVSPKSSEELWGSIGLVQNDLVLEKCIRYLESRRREESEQLGILKKSLIQYCGPQGPKHIRPVIVRQPPDAGSGTPAMVGLQIAGAQDEELKNLIYQNVVQDISITLSAEGVDNNQISAADLGANPNFVHTGRFNKSLECLFRLEGVSGKKRFYLDVDDRYVVTRRMCRLTGYLSAC